MPLFTYKALQTDGSAIEGELEAVGRQEALRQIDGRGLRPVRVTERGGANGKHAKPMAAKPASRISAKDKAAGKEPTAAPPVAEAPAKPLFGGPGKITARMLENFTRLLSSLLAAGVPLSRALTILQKEAANPVARAKWKEVHGLVVDGLPLAEAMARSPETFPRVYTAMVEAGETGGFLDVVLAQIADFQAREKEMRSKVSSAMMYPAILFCLAVVVLSALLLFFIPNIMPTFASFGAKLPLLTRGIMGASDLVRSYGLVIVIGLVVGGITLWNWFATEAGRRAWDGGILRMAVIGPLLSRFAMVRFCRMLGTLLGAGVPLVSALNVARRSIGNQILVDAVTASIESVKEGKQLGPSLGSCALLFPSSTTEMISVAEESGRLDSELVRIANFEEGDLDRNLKAAVSLLEPLMMFLIAGFIGTIFIGMLLPIFSMQDHIK